MQRSVEPALDAFLARAKAAPKSASGKALYDLLEQYLIRYLEDGRLEISNNRAERSSSLRE